MRECDDPLPHFMVRKVATHLADLFFRRHLNLLAVNDRLDELASIFDQLGLSLYDLEEVLKFLSSQNLLLKGQ